jgi:hypothetical protein
MTRSALEEYAAPMRRRYRAASKAEKTRILDQFHPSRGMHRKAAVRCSHDNRGQGRLAAARPDITSTSSSRCWSVFWDVSEQLCSRDEVS